MQTLSLNRYLPHALLQSINDRMAITTLNWIPRKRIKRSLEVKLCLFYRQHNEEGNESVNSLFETCFMNTEVHQIRFNT